MVSFLDISVSTRDFVQYQKALYLHPVALRQQYLLRPDR